MNLYSYGYLIVLTVKLVIGISSFGLELIRKMGSWIVMHQKSASQNAIQSQNMKKFVKMVLESC